MIPDAHAYICHELLYTTAGMWIITEMSGYQHAVLADEVDE